MLLHIYSGLMSRCNALAQAYSLIQDNNDSELTVIWPLEKDCNIRFYDAFEEDVFSDLKFKVIEYDSFRATDIKKIWPDIKGILSEIRQRKVYSKYRKKYLEALGDKSFVEYAPPVNIGWEGEIYHEFCKECWQKARSIIESRGTNKLAIHTYSDIVYGDESIKADYSCLKYKNDYLKTAEKIVSDRNTIGLHIRRTDHRAATAVSTDEGFIRKIEEEIDKNKNIRFFLASDSPETEKMMISRFGQRIVIQPDKIWGRDSREAVVSGIIDMLCLSLCDRIYGSYGSCFSMMAAQYGRKELITVKQ